MNYLEETLNYLPEALACLDQIRDKWAREHPDATGHFKSLTDLRDILLKANVASFSQPQENPRIYVYEQNVHLSKPSIREISNDKREASYDIDLPRLGRTRILAFSFGEWIVRVQTGARYLIDCGEAQTSLQTNQILARVPLYLDEGKSFLKVVLVYNPRLVADGPPEFVSALLAVELEE